MKIDVLTEEARIFRSLQAICSPSSSVTAGQRSKPRSCRSLPALFETQACCTPTADAPRLYVKQEATGTPHPQKTGLWCLKQTHKNQDTQRQSAFESAALWIIFLLHYLHNGGNNTIAFLTE